MFSASLGILLFFPVIIFSLTEKASSSVPNKELPLPVLNQSISEYTLSYFTNKQRTEHGLLALRNNLALQRAAQNKAEDMAKKEYFSHLSPEGKTPWDWIEEEATITIAPPEKIWRLSLLILKSWSADGWIRKLIEKTSSIVISKTLELESQRETMKEE